MRVSFLTMHSCPLVQAGERDTGGMNVYVLALAKELEAKDVCVDIFTRYHTSRDPEIVTISPHVRVIHMPGGDVAEEKEDLHLHVDEYVHAIESFRDREGLTYDLVHSHYWLSGQAGTTLASQWNVPHLTCFHTTAKIKNEAFLENQEAPQRAPAETQVMAEADQIIVFTQDEADALTRLYDAPQDKLSVIPIGVDFSLFQPRNRTQARQRVGIPAGEEALLYVGRLDPIKGAELLLHAASLLRERPRLHVRIVGGEQKPGERARLEQCARKLGIEDRASFFDPVPHEELPWLYAAVDMLVVPSYYESFSMVTAEALASGTPVVASDVGGPASLVHDGLSGYLVQPGDIRAFAQRIELLLDDTSLRETLAHHAPDTVAHLDWPTVAERIIEAYSATLDGAAELTPCAD